MTFIDKICCAFAQVLKLANKNAYFEASKILMLDIALEGKWQCWPLTETVTDAVIGYIWNNGETSWQHECSDENR